MSTLPASEHPAAQFSSDFAKAHGPNFLKWLGHLVGNPRAIGIELGTWRGESAEWLLDKVLTDPASRLHCVDTFKGSEEHVLAGIDCSGIHAETMARLKRFGPPRVTLHVGESHRVLAARLAGVLPRLVDFVYVDAAHDAMNVLRDAVLAFELLAVGGVMIFDDYEWKVMRDEVDRPKMAVDAFLACYARRVEVIGMGWQVALRKTA
jgi:predicted O-methyltransferase YrrM